MLATPGLPYLKAQGARVFGNRCGLTIHMCAARYSANIGLIENRALLVGPSGNTYLGLVILDIDS
jgi:hypothetical protein